MPPPWKVASLALALASLTAFLWPTLSLPYLGDDTFNAYLDGWIGYEHLSDPAALGAFFNATSVFGGRFYPIFAGIIFFDFHVIHNVFALKAIVAIAILVNAATLYAVVRLVAPRLAAPVVAFLPIALQIRYFHDPIVMFSLHMQIALECVLLAILGLASHLRSGRRRSLVAAVALFFLACLTYEPTYAFALVFLAFAFVRLRPFSRAATIGGSFLVPPAICGFVAFSFRAAHPLVANDQHALSAAPIAVLRALSLQTLAAFPMSYRAFDPGHFFTGADLSWNHASWAVAAFAFASIATSFGVPSAFANARDRLSDIRDLAAIAAAALVASGSIVSFSPRWQTELTPGLGYIPVYFGDFAIAVLVGCAAGAIVAIVGPAGPYAVALLGAIVIGDTYRANLETIAFFAPWNMTVPRALDLGLLRNAPHDAIVYVDDSYPGQTVFDASTWNAKYFFYDHTRVRYDVRSAATLPVSDTPGTALAVLGVTRGLNRGTVVAGRIVTSVPAAVGALPMVTSVRRFVRRPDGLETMSDWNSRCGPVAAESVLDGSPSAVALAFSPEFFAEEHDGSERWRWARSAASLTVVNPTTRSRAVVLHFTERANAAGAHLAIVAPRANVRAVSTSSDLPVSLALDVPERGSIAVRLTSDGTATIRVPDTRAVLFQVRDATVDESDCGSVM